jgi:hypothetical protein
MYVSRVASSKIACAMGVMRQKRGKTNVTKLTEDMMAKILEDDFDGIFSEIAPLLTPFSRKMLPVPDESQVCLHLTSMVNYWSLISPVVNAVRPVHVVEIGSYRGLTSRFLAKEIARFHGRLSVVDPAINLSKPPFFAHNTVFFAETSERWFQRNDRADIYFVDGDHCYRTVAIELDCISKMSGHMRPTVIFLHDVGWPCGYRDLYYQPSLDPQESDPAYERPCVLSFFDEACRQEVGWMSTLAMAAHEGGEGNGVRRAADDFLQGHPGWRFAYLPSMYGLGVLWRPGIFNRAATRELHSLEALFIRIAPYVATLELNRLMLICKITQQGKVWETQAEWIKQLERLVGEAQQRSDAESVSEKGTRDGSCGRPPR